MSRLKRSISALFGYDAVENTGNRRRRAPRARVQAEDVVLSAKKRDRLSASTRDLQRNYPTAAWAVRRHLDYVASFTFQSRTGDKRLDAEIEELVRWWSRPMNFDVSGRFSMRRFIRLLEASRTLDGDVFIMKMRDGRLQPIEADRVGNPRDLPKNIKDGTYVNGVQADATNRPIRYVICNRSARGGLEYNRIVPARHMVQHGFFHRFDQLRGVSPLASAINIFCDAYEGIDYALAKLKVAQLFGLVFYREAEEAMGVVNRDDQDEDGDGGVTEAEEDKSGYKVDFGKGPVVLDLEPGDRAEFLENKTPSTEFQAFIQVVTAIGLKSLDIPYSFYDEAHTNYSGARQALLQYEQSANEKRGDLQDVMNRLTGWRMRLFIEDGWLSLPAGMTLGDLKWEWIPNGLPWIDPLKEVKAEVASIEGKLRSRQEIVKARGRDWFEVLDELQQEEDELRSRGLIAEAKGDEM